VLWAVAAEVLSQSSLAVNFIFSGEKTFSVSSPRSTCRTTVGIHAIQACCVWVDKYSFQGTVGVREEALIDCSKSFETPALSTDKQVAVPGADATD